jgi:hypothetical protein
LLDSLVAEFVAPPPSIVKRLLAWRRECSDRVMHEEAERWRLSLREMRPDHWHAKQDRIAVLTAGGNNR